MLTLQDSRQLRQRIRGALGASLFVGLLRTIYVGPKKCRVCGSHVRKFKDQGYHVEVLFADKVVGGMPRRADECPVCRANSRVRLAYLYLTEVASIPPDARILHVAPERALQMHFRRMAAGLYVVADLVPERYVKAGHVCRLDVTALPFRDRQFDLVLCNHVLEHVPDDLQAMREIRRVLKKDGVSLLQVPFTTERDETRESCPDDTADDRLRKFGQADHVRLYAKADYLRRLNRCGLDVQVFWAWSERPDRASYFDIDPLEPLFVCRPR